MKNLENLNLQELTIQEQVKTDGGFLFFVAWAIGGVVAGAVSSASTTYGDTLVNEQEQKDISVAFGGSFMH